MRTTLMKENMGQCNLKEPFEFNSFSEIFYCGKTRLRNTSFGVFIECQHTRTILRNKNMVQSLFKKHSKFQNFNEIFYCGMKMTQEHECGCFYTMSAHKSHFRGALSGLRQESPLRIMKIAFYFTLKALFVLIKVFVLIFWSCSKTA